MNRSRPARWLDRSRAVAERFLSGEERRGFRVHFRSTESRDWYSHTDVLRLTGVNGGALSNWQMDGMTLANATEVAHRPGTRRVRRYTFWDVVAVQLVETLRRQRFGTVTFRALQALMTVLHRAGPELPHLKVLLQPSGEVDVLDRPDRSWHRLEPGALVVDLYGALEAIVAAHEREGLPLKAASPSAPEWPDPALRVDGDGLEPIGTPRAHLDAEEARA